MNGSSEEESYSGLRSQDLQEAKDQLLVETSDMLNIPLFTAEALLRDNGSFKSFLYSFIKAKSCLYLVAVTIRSEFNQLQAEKSHFSTAYAIQRPSAELIVFLKLADRCQRLYKTCYQYFLCDLAAACLTNCFRNSPTDSICCTISASFCTLLKYT